MIVNLNLRGKNVLVIGGGGEALKRINSLLDEGCAITVISGIVTPKVCALIQDMKIKFHQEDVVDVKILDRYEPNLIMVTTNDHKLNQKIVAYAQKNGIMVYSSDDPDSSDFAHAAVVDAADPIRIAIFTGGASPAVAKRIGARLGENIRRVVTKEDVGQAQIQMIVRGLAREKIPSQRDRKAFLVNLMDDVQVKQLIKDGSLKKAEDRAVAMLGDWIRTRK